MTRLVLYGSLAFVCAIAIALSAQADAELSQSGSLRVAVSGKLKPRSLPRKGRAPVRVSVASRIATTDQSLPPKLRRLRIEINRHGHLETRWLPQCPIRAIRTATSAQALRACRASLVGQGSFEAEVTLANQQPYASKARLLLFNGRIGCAGASRNTRLAALHEQRPARRRPPAAAFMARKHSDGALARASGGHAALIQRPARSRFQSSSDSFLGAAERPTTSAGAARSSRCRTRPVLFGQIYTARPFSTSFVVVFEIGKRRRGTFGTVLRATLPRTLGSWGVVTGIRMTLSRSYRGKGKRRSFLSAVCPAPKGFPGATFPLARTTFSFAGGRRLVSVLSDDCQVR